MTQETDHAYGTCDICGRLATSVYSYSTSATGGSEPSPEPRRVLDQWQCDGWSQRLWYLIFDQECKLKGWSVGVELQRNHEVKSVLVESVGIDTPTPGNFKSLV